MGSSGPKRRKPKRSLPRVPDSVPYPGPYRFWRKDRITRGHEKEALAAQRAKPVSRLGRMVLRLLGGGRGNRR